MISCYIVDDEFHATDMLSKYIKMTGELTLFGFSDNPVDALNIITRNPPDITFVDINLPQLSGMDFSLLINTYTHVIFTTAHAQYAATAFDNNAVDYLLKPFVYARFLKSIEKVKKYLFAQGNITQKHIALDHFYIKSGVKGKVVRINFNEINYIKGALNYVIIQLNEVEHLTYLTMKEIEEALPKKSFRRVHKSFIINENKIISIENGFVLLKSKALIPLGSIYVKEFLDDLNEIILNTKRTQS